MFPNIVPWKIFLEFVPFYWDLYGSLKNKFRYNFLGFFRRPGILFSPVGRAKTVTFFWVVITVGEKEYDSGGVNIVMECIEYLTKSISVNSPGSYYFLIFQVKHFSAFWNLKKWIYFLKIKTNFWILIEFLCRGIFVSDLSERLLNAPYKKNLL
jgi:hypothetical protein